MNHEDKQEARRRRELKMRRWLTTLTWTLPVFSFGGFFAVWNEIAHAHPSSHAVANSSTSTSKANRSTTATASSPILFKIGSRSVQVARIQEQLAELGLFHHTFSDYYGSVTSNAVKQFQAAHNLPATGSVDHKTLITLQKAVRAIRTQRLTQSSESSGSSGGSSSPHSSAGHSSVGQSSVGQSQGSLPQTSSSAS